MSALASFAEAYAARFAPPSVRSLDAVGVIGLDVPVEVLRAAGLTPVRVIAEPSSTAIPQFSEGAGSPYLRGLAGALIDGEHRHLRRLVMSTTPSSLAALYAFLRELKRSGEGLCDVDIHLFDLNRGPSPAMAAARRAAVEALRERAGAWAGRPVSDVALADAVAAADAARAALAEFQALRQSAPARMWGAEALTVFGGASAMSAEELPPRLADLAREMSSRAPLTGRRTVYSGTETLSADLYRRLEEGGLVIVADDQDAGSRSVGPVAGAADDLAERCYRRDPSPARSGVEARTTYLTSLVRAAGAEHVVFHFAPWDHPPAWDYPHQRAALEAMGVSCELIEDGHG